MNLVKKVDIVKKVGHNKMDYILIGWIVYLLFNSPRNIPVFIL